MSGAIADGYYGSNVLESDETNNALAGNTIAITRLYADLIMTSVIATPATANTGDTITVTAIVKNQGGWAAGGFYVPILPVHGQHDHEQRHVL